MPFGPVNAPSFYSCMMGNLNKEWDDLFIERLQEYATSGKLVDDQLVTLRQEYIYLGVNKLYSGTKLIIDDIIIWSSTIAVVIVYFYVCAQCFKSIACQAR